MQDNATDHLHIEMAQTQGALRCFAHRRKGFGQYGIERGTICQFFAEIAVWPRNSSSDMAEMVGSKALIFSTILRIDAT